MAQGTLTVFEEVRLTMGEGVYNLATDAFKCMLITTIPTAADLTPDSTDYTEVSGTGYTAGGESLTTTYTEAAGTATFDSSANPAWTQNGAGPTNIKAALIYDTTIAGSTDAIAYIDMTVDAGTTPISLVDGDITITFNASGIFTLA